MQESSDELCHTGLPASPPSPTPLARRGREHIPAWAIALDFSVLSSSLLLCLEHNFFLSAPRVSAHLWSPLTPCWGGPTTPTAILSPTAGDPPLGNRLNHCYHHLFPVNPNYQVSCRTTGILWLCSSVQHPQQGLVLKYLLGERPSPRCSSDTLRTDDAALASTPNSSKTRAAPTFNRWIGFVSHLEAG